MIRRFFSGAGVASMLAALGLMVGTSVAWADPPPSGEVQVGQSVLEPAYNDANGALVYLSTPQHAAVNPNSHNTAPLYAVLYPKGSTVGTLNCAHNPLDNCPDHGPQLAGLAESPGNPWSSIYANGVLGHDHLVGIASTGGDFNVDWEPVAVLFTDPSVVNEHITTLSQLNELEANGQVIEIPLPQATFHCSVVSASKYQHGTPVTPVPGF